MSKDKFKSSHEIYNLAEHLMNLYEQAYEEIKPDVFYIINKNVKNVRYIEDVLDRIFEIPTDKSYELFIMLCNYYATFDMDAAKFYLDSWDMLYGEDKTKVKKKYHK